MSKRYNRRVKSGVTDIYRPSSTRAWPAICASIAAFGAAAWRARSITALNCATRAALAASHASTAACGSLPPPRAEEFEPELLEVAREAGDQQPLPRIARR